MINGNRRKTGGPSWPRFLHVCFTRVSFKRGITSDGETEIDLVMTSIILKMFEVNKSGSEGCASNANVRGVKFPVALCVVLHRSGL